VKHWTEDQRWYHLTWTTRKGKIDVRVLAAVGSPEARGAVHVAGLTDAAGQALRMEEFVTAERLGLYEAVRRAAGLCSRCGGCGSWMLASSKRVRVRETCPRCCGSGNDPDSPKAVT
jgi:hypothetical protein